MLGSGSPFRHAVSAAVSRRMLLRASALAIGASIVVPALAPASIPVTSRAWAAEQLVITSDNSGGALVSGSNLGPGAMPPACLKISYTGSVANDQLRLFTTTGGSGLADYLDVTIEQGQGGRYGDCSQFTGTSVYAGTLGALGRDHGGELTALPIAGFAAGAGDVSVRLVFTLRDDNRAQSGSATADFTWIAGPGASSTPGGSTPGGSTPGGTPGGSTPAVQPKPKPSAVVTVPLTGPPASPAKKPSKASAVRKYDERHQAAVEQAKVAVASLAQKVWDQVRRVGEPLIKGAAFGLGTLPLVLLYLLIQNRIDRGDPKLAKAPSYADPDLVFGDMPQAVA